MKLRHDATKLTQKNSKMMLIKMDIDLHNKLREFYCDQDELRLIPYINSFILDAVEEKLKKCKKVVGD